MHFGRGRILECTPSPLNVPYNAQIAVLVGEIPRMKSDLAQKQKHPHFCECF